MSKPSKAPKQKVTGVVATAFSAAVLAPLFGLPAWAEPSTHSVCTSGCGFTSIQAAVNFAIDGDTIKLGPETFYESVAVFEKQLTIRGAGSDNTVIDGDGTAMSVFRVQAGFFGDPAALVLENVTIRNGESGVLCAAGFGFGASPAFLGVTNSVIRDNDVGIQSCFVCRCAVNLEGSVVSNNTSYGITGNASIIDTTVVDNDTGVYGFAYWGGFDVGQLFPGPSIVDSWIGGNRVGVEGSGYQISGSTIIGNVTGVAGGDFGEVVSAETIVQSLIVGNSGDGIAGGNPVITTSTISGNGGSGMALLGYVSYYGDTFGNATILNSSISGNGDAGVRVEVTEPGALPAVVISHGTVTENAGGGLVLESATGQPAGHAFFNLEWSVVAGNPGGDCVAGQHISSGGYNLGGDSSCYLTQPGDIVGLDPLLLPLGDNGGPTPTHGLAFGSPAIDAGGPECEPTDQRGIARPQDGDADGYADCDIGAFERLANQSPTAVCVDAVVAADELCLGSADVDGGSSDPDHDPITLSREPPGPYDLGETLVTLTVTDDEGASGACTATVTVEDTTPPDLTVSLDPDTLWPPNHRMVDVAATWLGSDNCGMPGVVLTSVSSNEVDNGDADGNTVNDIQGAETGTGDTQFLLRAERAGGGNGRIYTAAYTATDLSGNTRTEAGFAVVPHDQGAVDPIETLLDHDAYGTLLWWSAVSGVESNNVIRGDLNDVIETEIVIDLGVVTCIEAASSDTSTAGFEDADAPAPGEAFFYLVEYFDGTSSSYGTESASKPRAPAQGACQ